MEAPEHVRSSIRMQRAVSDRSRQEGRRTRHMLLGLHSVPRVRNHYARRKMRRMPQRNLPVVIQSEPMRSDTC